MKILIAEDDFTSRVMLLAVLKKWKFNPIATENGAEAWNVMQRADAPKLVLLNGNMPEMDGLEVTRRVRGMSAAEPPYIIILTARGEKYNIVQGLEAGANDYVAKPYDHDELRARLEVGRRMVELQSALALRTRELQEAEKRCRSIVENTAEGVIRSTPEGRCTTVNPVFNKMEAMGTLAGGLAHDFNNILASIIGYTELAMLRGVPEESQAGNCLEQVLKASHRARELIKQILMFTGQSDVEKRPVQVTPIIKETVKLLRAAIPTNIAILRKISATSDVVLADPIQIHLALMNLCANAAHAMREEGGVLTIMMTDMDADDHSEPLTAPRNNGRCLALSVSDTGHGIEPEHMDKIFDPFFTTKVSGEGTGMGLSVVYGIVKDLNGDITVQSERNKGSIFSISLPMCDEHLIASLSPLPSLPSGSECVLLVDDEESLITIGKDILEYLGYKVISAMGGMEALDAFRTLPEQFDLVITDLSMPIMSGFGLADELLKIRPDIPIILCTGLGQAGVEEEARCRGIRQVLIKPFDMENYAKIIREVLGEGKDSYNSLDSLDRQDICEKGTRSWQTY